VHLSCSDDDVLARLLDQDLHAGVGLVEQAQAPHQRAHVGGQPGLDRHAQDGRDDRRQFREGGGRKSG